MNRRDPLLDPPRADDDRSFAEPWQAQAFAVTLELHRKGLFSWNEWAESLSTELNSANAVEDGSDYYDRWLRALENLLAAKGVLARKDVDTLAEAWQRAAHATPHGEPILLENDPQGAN